VDGAIPVIAARSSACAGSATSSYIGAAFTFAGVAIGLTWKWRTACRRP
jgi:hypothetical protein